MALKILVADDATFIRDMIKKQLRENLPGVELFDAIDGQKALDLFRRNAVDLVLSDWEMPNLTGEEFLRHVRTGQHAPKTPFIMITSRGDRDHVVKAVQSGVSDYITKPFTADELIRKVHKQLRAIGKLPVLQTKPAGVSGIAAGSVGILTGAVKAEPKAAVAVSGGSAALLTGQSVTTKPAAVPEPKPKGQAQLRFAENLTVTCVIREMTLQMMSCVLPRGKRLPQVFEQVVVDVDMGQDKGLARVNGYVHGVTAGENHPNASSVKIIIRFVDNDVDKFEILSKYIAQL